LRRLALVYSVPSDTPLPVRLTAPHYDLTLCGSSILDDARDSYGEPLNVLLLNLFETSIKTDSSQECFGSLHSADIGDEYGWVDQTYELCQDDGNTGIGTCLGSLIGGSHLRSAYRQGGTLADSGALFL
ncbi:hypothetical protein BU15DRAFT_35983, partial [Melanogaster broomeanus]